MSYYGGFDYGDLGASISGGRSRISSRFVRPTLSFSPSRSSSPSSSMSMVATATPSTTAAPSTPSILPDTHFALPTTSTKVITPGLLRTETPPTPSPYVPQESGAFQFAPGRGGPGRMCAYYMLSREHRNLERLPLCRFVKAAKFLKRERPDDEDTRASDLRTLIVVLNASADQAERMNHDDNEDKLRRRASARLKKLRSILRRKELPAPNLKRLGFLADESLSDAVGDFFGDLGAAAEDITPMTKNVGALLSIGLLVWYVTKK